MDFWRSLVIFCCYGLLCANVESARQISGARDNYCPKTIPPYKWNARVNNVAMLSMKSIKTIEIHHSPYNETCKNIRTCPPIVKKMQNLDMDTFHLRDTRYSFFLGFDSNIYQGIGFRSFKSGDNTRPSTKLQICIVGGGSPSTPPTRKMIENFFAFLNCHQKLLVKKYTMWVGLKNEFDAIKGKKKQYEHILARVKVAKGEPLVIKVPPPPKTFWEHLYEAWKKGFSKPNIYFS